MMLCSFSTHRDMGIISNLKGGQCNQALSMQSIKHASSSKQDFFPVLAVSVWCERTLKLFKIINSVTELHCGSAGRTLLVERTIKDLEI